MHEFQTGGAGAFTRCGKLAIGKVLCQGTTSQNTNDHLFGEHQKRRLLSAEGFGERVEEIQRLPIGVDGQALVLAVGAVIVALQRNGGIAV